MEIEFKHRYDLQKSVNTGNLKNIFEHLICVNSYRWKPTDYSDSSWNWLEFISNTIDSNLK